MWLALALALQKSFWFISNFQHFLGIIFYVKLSALTFFVSMAPGDSLQMTSAGEWAMDLVSTNSHRLPPLSSHFGQHWYPLDFLPNYPALKCFITSAYEAGTVLMISISITSLPRCHKAPWTRRGKQKYSWLLKLALPRLCLGTTVQ